MDLSISKDFRDCFDTLNVFQNMQEKSFSHFICLAVQEYVRNNISNSPNLIVDEELWNNIIDKMDKNDILEMDRLITKLHGKLIEKL